MAKKKIIYGITDEREIKSNELYRGTKKKTQYFADFLKKPRGAGAAIVSCAFLALIIPMLSESMLVLGVIFALYNLKQDQSLPFRMPKYAKLKDYNDVGPSGKANQSSGIFYLGVDSETGRELWFTKSDVCTHQLIFGTTGAGKTETLLSMVFNALVQGSGFAYVDGKGDTSLWKKAYSLGRSMGRDDDLLLINYMTGDQDVRAGVLKPKLSHNSNPFATGSSSSLSNLLTSLMDGGSEGKGGDMWKGRAISLASALMLCLSYLRDIGEIFLDVHTVREYMHINKLIDMSKRTDFPEDAKNALKGYLDSLPGFNDKKGYNQVDSVSEQHGFLYMQFTKILGSLSETYGHIFKTQMGEVDMYDVVVNRRILITMLPALEKPDDELTNLGKIIVSMLKSMMSACLGSEVIGETTKIYDTKATNSETPFPVVLDEYGYYAVKGTAVMFAQARSLNIQLIGAGQDYPAFKKGSPEEAASIVANCNIKICGKLEDPTETLDIVQKAGGEAYTTHTSGFKRTRGVLFAQYSDDDSSNVDKRYRIDFKDLKGQGLGEMHVIMGTKIVRANMFYANPKDPFATRLNNFLKIKPPSAEVINQMNESLSALSEKLQDPNLHKIMPKPDPSADINFMVTSLMARSKMKESEETIAMIVDFERNKSSSIIQKLLVDKPNRFNEDEMFDISDINPDSMSIFGEKITTDSDIAKELNALDMISSSQILEDSDVSSRMHNEMFGESLGSRDLMESIARNVVIETKMEEGLDRHELNENIKKVELEVGELPDDSKNVADNLVDRLEEVTLYPENGALAAVDEQEFTDAMASAFQALEDLIKGDEEEFV